MAVGGAASVRARVPRPVKAAGRSALYRLDGVRHRLAGTPVPPWALRSKVGGDFWGVGVEFRSYMVDLGGLRPDARVLDIGCKAGRMAIPLARYLGPDARYEAVDDWPEANEWCRRAISSRHPNFGFHQVAMVTQEAGDRGTPAPAPLPFEDAAFDFAVFGSINHLTPGAFDYYLAEAARLLRDGGTYFGTWYLQARPGSQPPGPPGPLACTEAEATARLAELGLAVTSVHRGTWDGHRPSLSYQDVVVGRRGG